MDAAEIVHEFPSTTQTFVAAQLEGLRDAGVNLRVFADGPGHGLAAADGVRYYGLPFKDLRESAGSWRSRRDTESRRVPLKRRKPGELAKLRIAFEARAFRPSRTYDVIHAHFGPNGLRAIRLRNMGVVRGPVLTSFYGYDVGRHGVTVGYASLFEKGDRFIALSDHMKASLIALGCPAERLIVHRLGVNPDRFTPAARAGPGLEVLSIARLVEKKGIDHGLRAVAEVARGGIDVRYTIAGDGHLRGQLERLSRELSIERMVSFIGAQPPNTIPRLLQAADVLIAPSVTARDGDAEGTPVSILEAQAAGLPVVSTLHAGIPEIVEDGSSGFLVPEGDAPALAERLVELSRSASLRATMGIAGRAIVMGRHDIRVLNRDLLQIYGSVRNV